MNSPTEKEAKRGIFGLSDNQSASLLLVFTISITMCVVVAIICLPIFCMYKKDQCIAVNITQQECLYFDDRVDSWMSGHAVSYQIEHGKSHAPCTTVCSKTPHPPSTIVTCYNLKGSLTCDKDVNYDTIVVEAFLVIALLALVSINICIIYMLLKSVKHSKTEFIELNELGESDTSTK
jgi:hypothetical protein